ncbi:MULTISPECIES: efflux RND transporter periplasmic adaptor subunit [Empedobacter]|uniref:Efflux RND transporter periplasmic adaptor subunit n=1 Tax=Empedobacter falsenii TaxID=343874 RepID=A0A7H9DTX1_9FLAO|nr:MULTISPECIES: efflux RND transporter periplasmic adaptor subunit [Empedobacter]MDH2206609.1 HlyD family efflux transporter periplasmic adaptor subunit [Empedobacter sp. GD03644]QLL58186.1 efflux RND transporter periplasmic adaptor subunit [Empedobacter falsenii]
MDTKINQKNKKYKRLGIIAATTIILGGSSFYLMNPPRTLTVSANELMIKDVSEDYFEDFVVFQAQIEPINSIFINVIEGGSVQEIFVENGEMVTKGLPIARLYNPNTELNFLTQETAIIEQMNQLNVAKLSIRNQELDLSKDFVGIEHDFNQSKLDYELNQKLYDREVLAKNEWENTKEKMRYQQERKAIIQKSLVKERESNSIQLKQINEALSIMQKSLVTLRKNKQNFLVLAPETGRLSSFEATLGQSIEAGKSIGKVDILSGYKLVAMVDEYYLDRIQENQYGQIEIKGKIIKVKVTKISPEIKSGKFKTELEFIDKIPENLQEGLSVGVKLILSEKEKKLVIPKGSFYTTTQGKWIFVINNDKAIRRKIELGRENPSVYEVISGLKTNEKVIISNYEDYKEVQELTIKK